MASLDFICGKQHLAEGIVSVGRRFTRAPVQTISFQRCGLSAPFYHFERVGRGKNDQCPRECGFKLLLLQGG